MSLNVDKPFGSLKINDHQLPFLIEHKVFRLDIAIQIPTVVNKLQDFKYIYKYRFGW